MINVGDLIPLAGLTNVQKEELINIVNEAEANNTIIKTNMINKIDKTLPVESAWNDIEISLQSNIDIMANKITATGKVIPENPTIKDLTSKVGGYDVGDKISPNVLGFEGDGVQVFANAISSSTAQATFLTETDNYIYYTRTGFNTLFIFNKQTKKHQFTISTNSIAIAIIFETETKFWLIETNGYFEQFNLDSTTTALYSNATIVTSHISTLCGYKQVGDDIFVICRATDNNIYHYKFNTVGKTKTSKAIRLSTALVQPTVVSDSEFLTYSASGLEKWDLVTGTLINQIAPTLTAMSFIDFNEGFAYRNITGFIEKYDIYTNTLISSVPLNGSIIGLAKYGNNGVFLILDSNIVILDKNLNTLMNTYFGGTGIGNLKVNEYDGNITFFLNTGTNYALFKMLNKLTIKN